MRVRCLALSLAVLWLVWACVAPAGQAPFLGWQRLKRPMLAWRG